MQKATNNTVTLPHPNKLLIIEPLDYDNPYDFHTPHRHDYFEIILINGRTGKQQIDFGHHEIIGGQIFTVYPGQIHLMQRNTATGLIIQFRKDIFEYLYPLRHYNLYFNDPVFNPDAETFNHLYQLSVCILSLMQRTELPLLSTHKAYSYLEIILITLCELKDAATTPGNYLISQFLSLLTQHIRTHKKVGEYATMLGCTPDKLNTACKMALGKNALELIHEELLLEIRRLMVLGQLTLKEIAFELNFDSQANFNGFIKNNTDITPSQLQNSLQIYK